MRFRLSAETLAGWALAWALDGRLRRPVVTFAEPPRCAEGRSGGRRSCCSAAAASSGEASTDEALAAGACRLAASQEEAPFYVALERIRSDIRLGRIGVPLRLRITVLDAVRAGR